MLLIDTYFCKGEKIWEEQAEQELGDLGVCALL